MKNPIISTLILLSTLASYGQDTNANYIKSLQLKGMSKDAIVDSTLTKRWLVELRTNPELKQLVAERESYIGSLPMQVITHNEDKLRSESFQKEVGEHAAIIAHGVTPAQRAIQLDDLHRCENSAAVYKQQYVTLEQMMRSENTRKAQIETKLASLRGEYFKANKSQVTSYVDSQLK